MPGAAEPLQIGGSTDAAGAQEHWAELARLSTNIFSTWEWLQIWWRHFGAGHELDVVTLPGSDGTPRAIVPLVRERRAGITIVRVAGYGVGDELGPVCAPSDCDAGRQALELVTRRGDVLLIERLPDRWSWTPPSARLLNIEASPTIRLAEFGSWEEYLHAHSANFRQQVRRRARRLDRTLELRYRLCTDPKSLPSDLDLFFALHRARWGSESQAFDGRREGFHRDFAAEALRCGWLRLWMAESRGDPVAAWLGYRFGGVESYYQSGRDPRWNRYQVGSGILEHSIREAFADGMTEYRLLRGHERYKRRYASGNSRLRTLVVPSSTVGRAVVMAADALATRTRGRRLLSALAA
jgi:CelD/BcsL family acetyltransferase involved in cellulose biosynthesis